MMTLTRFDLSWAPARNALWSPIPLTDSFRRSIVDATGASDLAISVMRALIDELGERQGEPLVAVIAEEQDGSEEGAVDACRCTELIQDLLAAPVSEE